MNLLQKIILFEEPLEKFFQVHADCAIKIIGKLKEFDGDRERLMREVRRLEFNTSHIARAISKHFEDDGRKKKVKVDSEVEGIVAGWLK